MRFDMGDLPWHHGFMTTTTQLSTNAFHYPAYVKYLTATTAHGFAAQIMSVAVSWQVYDITRNPFDLGLVGLSLFAPSFLLVLVTGLVADRFNRRLILALCLGVEAVVALGLLAFTLSQPKVIWPVFCLLVLLGSARAFFNPASDALSPNLISKAAIPHAISLNSMTWQTASIIGPALGGLLYGLGGHVAYGVALGLICLAAVLVFFVGHVAQDNHVEETTIGTLLAGFKFIKSEKIVLGAISLDLFAVLLGGAVALMPVYARDILHANETGLGLLRASPGVGAVVMALWLSKFGIKDHAGKIMFACVAGFGLGTMMFGASSWLPLSILALMAMGAFDMVSVYVRETLMQLWIKDEVRGRVNAVNRVFIGASNELGEFRAGVVASRIGAVAAVVIGGAGTMAVSALWSHLFPQLRDARRLSGPDR
jgi:MFS family permease